MKEVKNSATLLNYVDRMRDSDLWFSFTRSPVIVTSACVTLLFLIVTIFAPFVAPHDPFDLASIDLLDASLPPFWMEEGEIRFILGTDDQGRDILSTIIYGSRISLFVGFASVVFSLILGVGLGLISGYVGGRLIIHHVLRMYNSLSSYTHSLIGRRLARTFLSRTS